MTEKIKVAYDISLLGGGYISQQSRTGIFRAIEETLLALRAQSEIAAYPVSLNQEATLWDDISSRLYCESEQPELMADYHRIHRSRLNLMQAYSALVNCQKAFITSSKSRKSLPYKAGRALQVLGSRFARVESSVEERTCTYDIYHGAYFPLPDGNMLPDVPRILTVYDLIPVLFPEFVVPKVHKRTVDMLRSVNIHRDWIVCISEHTKQDFCRYTGMNPSRVFVIPLAASDDFYPIHDTNNLQAVLAHYGLSESPYILSLCTLEPRKNLDTLVAAFSSFVEVHPQTDLNLVLVGISGWKNELIFEAVQNNPLVRQRIILTGYIPDEHLAHIYTGALAFAYPSLYEGFGLPPLEAMQCGTPVIASNASSLPEVIGDAGILVDPMQSSELTNAIEQLVHDSQLRENLSQKALKRASEFSWSKVADATVNVYKKAISSHA